MRSLRSKLVLIFGTCMILILGIVVGFAAYKFREQAILSGQIHILQGADQAIYELVIIALGLVVFGIVAILFGTARFVKPIRKLSEITRSVARGERDPEILITGKDEIGDLAENFRVMLDSRKKTEEVLFQQQQHLAAIFDRAPVGMVLFTPDLRVVKINQKATAMFGYREHDTQEKLIGEILQCATIAETGLRCGNSINCKICFLREILGKVIATGEAVQGKEGWFYQEYGTVRKLLWLELSAESIKTESEFQIVLTLVDATEHKKDKEKLESNEKLLGTILDRLPVGMVLIDTSSHIIRRVNPYAASMIGASEEQILGKVCHNYICPTERGKCPISDLGKQVEDKERVLLTAFGAEVPIIKTVVPVTLEGTDYLLETFIDISEIKQMEDDLRRAKQEVESSLTSAELYAKELEIANDELDTALIAAKQASVAKSEFLANMSHEIRTPMNGIIGFTGILMEMELEPRPRELLALIKLSADSMLHLINDILDFSKIEAGRMELELHNFSLRKTLDETLSVFWVASKDKGLSLKWYVDEDVPDYFSGDARRLGQVLTNLVGNGIKFTEQGFVEVSVHMQRCEKENAVLHFIVRDSGIGIVSEKQLEIFQEFSQGDSSHTRKYGGTGLGLAISAKLVTLMGGRIWVESKNVDKIQGEAFGSAFHFTVNLNQSFSVEKKTETEILSKGSQKQIFEKQISVLLAEDDEINRLYMEELLGSRNCQVNSVENGLEVLDALGKEQFDIILMDIQMPEMDGFQTIKKIRKQEKGTGQHIPVIALTAHAMSEHRDESLLAGMDGCLSKPLVVDELMAVMNEFI